MTSQKNKRIILISFIIVLFLLMVVFICMKGLRSKNNSGSDDTFNSIFVSMYPIDGFSEESFLTYRGLDTRIDARTVTDIKKLTKSIEDSLKSSNAITTVYVGLDPYMFYSDQIKSDTDMATEMAPLLNCVASHSEVTFEFLLPVLPMEQWVALEQTEVADILTAYYFAVSCLEPHANALCFFAGGEEWLIRNNTNFTDNQSLNSLVADKIMCSTFCDRLMQIQLSNADTVLTSLYDMVMNEKASPTRYPDWSDKTIVFFGDSILGLQNGSYSIPGVINGLTGATVYNYAIGGTCACDTVPALDDRSFKDRLDIFLSRTDMYTNDNTVFPYNAHADGSNLIFVISYGYNDYKNQQGADNFRQALSTEITRLQTAYPAASILIMAPYECVWSIGGAATENEKGEKLSIYTDMVKEVAAERNIIYLDVPSLLEEDVNETNFTKYFNDECHYSEYGRFYMAEQIIYAQD